jgi:hypothetical protein
VLWAVGCLVPPDVATGRAWPLAAGSPVVHTRLTRNPRKAPTPIAENGHRRAGISGIQMTRGQQMRSSAGNGPGSKGQSPLRQTGVTAAITWFALLVAACTGGGSGGSVTTAGACGSSRITNSATGTASPDTRPHNGTGKPVSGGHLVLDYRHSQVTGWSAPYSPTIGRHIAAKDFTCRGKAYRLSLLAFGQSGRPPTRSMRRFPRTPSSGSSRPSPRRGASTTRVLSG